MYTNDLRSHGFAGKPLTTDLLIGNNLSTANPIETFPGQYYDTETGFHYNYYRYYDPRSGRYLRADPIGLDGGTNLYAYVENNPVNSYDFEGLIGPFGPGWTNIRSTHPNRLLADSDPCEVLGSGRGVGPSSSVVLPMMVRTGRELLIEEIKRFFPGNRDLAEDMCKYLDKGALEDLLKRLRPEEVKPSVLSKVPARGPMQPLFLFEYQKMMMQHMLETGECGLPAGDL